MKKSFYILAALLLLLSTQVAYSQTKQTVFGINANTTLKKFDAALATKGIKPKKTVKGRRFYNVTYAGYTRCEMEIKFNSGNDSILSVKIDIPHESYSKDKDIFWDLTQQFKEKHGEEKDPLGELNKLLPSSHQTSCKQKVYGNLRDGTLTYVTWHFNDDENDDGVYAKYITKAEVEKENKSVKLDL